MVIFGCHDVNIANECANLDILDNGLPVLVWMFLFAAI